LQERHKATTVREYKEFVKRLPQLQAAKQAAGLYTTIAELIKETTTSESFLDTVQCEQGARPMQICFFHRIYSCVQKF
jgi:hypothetical protein